MLVWSDARWEVDDPRPAGVGFVVAVPRASAAASTPSPSLSALADRYDLVHGSAGSTPKREEAQWSPREAGGLGLVPAHRTLSLVCAALYLSIYCSITREGGSYPV